MCERSKVSLGVLGGRLRGGLRQCVKVVKQCSKVGFPVVKLCFVPLWGTISLRNKLPLAGFAVHRPHREFKNVIQYGI